MRTAISLNSTLAAVAVLAFAVIRIIVRGSDDLMEGIPGIVLATITGLTAALTVLFLLSRVLPDLLCERRRRKFAAEGAWNAHIAEIDRLQARRRWLGFAVSTALVLSGALAIHAAGRPEDAGIWAYLPWARYPAAFAIIGGVLAITGTCGQGLMLFLTPEEPAANEPPIMLHNEPLTVDQARELVGKEGHVQAALRPQGNLKLDGETYVVKSEGQFIEEGTPVRVDRIDGPNIVVVPLREDG